MKLFTFLLLTSGYISYVLAAPTDIDDKRLKQFFSTRTSMTSDLDQVQKAREESKKNMHKKQVDVNQRSSMMAHNWESRYPVLDIVKKKKPRIIRELDRAKLTDVHLDKPEIKTAVIVSPKSPKNMNLSPLMPRQRSTAAQVVPNFSWPFRSQEPHSITEEILKEYEYEYG